MSFNQRKFDIATEQTRGIFNTYVYQTDDTAAEVLESGYFSESRFPLVDGDGCSALIRCCCSDGFFEGFVGGTGTITPIEPAVGGFGPVITSDTVIDETSASYAVDCSGGDVTITLPPLGYGSYNIKKIDASTNVVIIDAGANGSTLDGQSTRNVVSQWNNIQLINGDAEWYRL